MREAWSRLDLVADRMSQRGVSPHSLRYAVDKEKDVGPSTPNVDRASTWSLHWDFVTDDLSARGPTTKRLAAGPPRHNSCRPDRA